MRDGVLEQVGSRWQLRFERWLAHPPEKVWRALTEPEQVAVWFPTEILGERVAGAPLTFRFVDQDFPPTEGVLLRFEPPSLPEFTWGEETLRFELSGDHAGCRLLVLVQLSELGQAARDGAGWHECLDLLETHLLGGSTWPLGQHWADLARTYVTAFGPEASTVGPPDGWEPPAEPSAEPSVSRTRTGT